jgi:hypothetical protein
MNHPFPTTCSHTSDTSDTTCPSSNTMCDPYQSRASPQSPLLQANHKLTTVAPNMRGQPERGIHQWHDGTRPRTVENIALSTSQHPISHPWKHQQNLQQPAPKQKPHRVATPALLLPEGKLPDLGSLSDELPLFYRSLPFSTLLELRASWLLYLHNGLSGPHFCISQGWLIETVALCCCQQYGGNRYVTNRIRHCDTHR